MGQRAFKRKKQMQILDANVCWHESSLCSKNTISGKLKFRERTLCVCSRQWRENERSMVGEGARNVVWGHVMESLGC